jgi:hypothetical protein
MTPASAVLEWHRQLAEGDQKWMAPDANLSEQEWDALLDGDLRRSREAFKKPIKSWEDVALLGAVAMQSARWAAFRRVRSRPLAKDD